MSTFAPGATLGRYRIERVLGTGAMGEVYRAEDPQIGRHVALKTLRMVGVQAAELAERRQRLLREARTAGRLNHPNVVTLFDAGEDEGFVYLAFELVDGSDLSVRLAKGPPLTLGDALRLMGEACRGLDHAHQAGVVHRDIKPSNLMLDTAGGLKISDFGIAKLAGQATELTVTGSVMGSPFYLSPEQVRGEELDGRSDLFSLGVVLYELLSRRRPFEGDTISTLVFQILQADPPPLGSVRPDLPARLCSLVDRMLSKGRDERPASAAVVAEELAAVAAGLDARALAAAASGAQDPEEPTRRLETGEEPAAASSPAPPAPAAVSPPPPPPPASVAPTVASDAMPASAPPAPSAAAPAGAITPAAGGASGRPRWLLPAVGCGAALLAVAVAVVAVVWMGSPLDPREVLARSESTESADASGSPGADGLPAEARPGQAGDPGDAQLGDIDRPINGGWIEEFDENEGSALPETAAGDVAPPAPAASDPPPASSSPPPRREPTVPPAAKPEPEPAEAPPTGSAAGAGSAPAPASQRRSVVPDTGVTSGLSLVFRVVPKDAFVLIDGTVIGRAEEWGPDGRTYELPGPGTYDVTLRKGGMKDRVVRVQASGDRAGSTTIAARLEPLPIDEVDVGDLEVHRVREAVAFRVQPRNAQIVVDGQRVGAASRYSGGLGRRGWLELPRGLHRISIVAPGRQRVDLAVEITAGAVERRKRIDVVMRGGGG